MTEHKDDGWHTLNGFHAFSCKQWKKKKRKEDDNQTMQSMSLRFQRLTLGVSWLRCLETIVWLNYYSKVFRGTRRGDDRRCHWLCWWRTTGRNTKLAEAMFFLVVSTWQQWETSQCSDVKRHTNLLQHHGKKGEMVARGEGTKRRQGRRSSTGLTSEGNQTSNKVLAFAVFKKKNFWFCRV